jgi:hypothetical protein
VDAPACATTRYDPAGSRTAGNRFAGNLTSGIRLAGGVIILGTPYSFITRSMLSSASRVAGVWSWVSWTYTLTIDPKPLDTVPI